jgi:hypothetical protein
MQQQLLPVLLQCGCILEAHIYDVVSSTLSAWGITCRGGGLHFSHYCAC